MLFFIYRYITSEEEAPPSRTPPPENNANTEADNIPSEDPEPIITTTPPPSMTRATTTPPETGSNDAFVFIPGDYDKEFFANNLFIGDSIMTGIHLYGHIPAGNVFAKVGLNLVSVLTTEIDDETVLSKAVRMKPARIFIMLGSNEIGYSTGADMIPRMLTFIDTLKNKVPDSEVIVLTISPVTAAHEQSRPENMEDINNYNNLLKEASSANNFFLIDVGEILKDSTGYFAQEYAESDGLHFKSGAYKAILSYIQFTIENS
jgi:lysophospholipase L1-like esterase